MRLFALVFAASALLVSCTSQQTVKEALLAHPEWVAETIQKHPETFGPVFANAENASREMAAKQQADAERVAREEDFKNPKKPTISSERAMLGSKDAPVMLVVYSDFQCPFCKRGYETVEQLRTKYGTKMAYVFKHLPLPFHQHAMIAAKYFEAVAMQNPATAYKLHDAIFTHQDQFTNEGEKFLAKTTKGLGVDMKRLKKDLTSDTVTAHIKADTAEAQSFGIGGTPGFIIGGVVIRGAYPAAEFEAIADRILGQAQTVSLN
jgi:protein-disulfide isomerase